MKSGKRFQEGEDWLVGVAELSSFPRNHKTLYFVISYFSNYLVYIILRSFQFALIIHTKIYYNILILTQFYKIKIMYICSDGVKI